MEASTSGSELPYTEVVKYKTYLTAWVARKRNEYGQYKKQRANFIVGEREKYKSYAECERAWEATEHGNKYLQLHEQIKAVELLIDDLKTTYFNYRSELKNEV